MEYSVSDHNNGKLVTLMGLINEDAEFAFQNLAADLKDAAAVAFHFAQVKSINSLGVRAWVSFLRGVEEGKTITFLECTSDVIMQINMIPSFLGKGEVESFYVNYVCEVCNKEEKKLLLKNQLPKKSIPKTPKCDADDCGLQTEELEEEYFAFLTR